MKIKTVLLFLITVSLSAIADTGDYAPGNGPGAYTGKELPKSSAEVPEELRDVGITERLGESIDLNLKVRNEAGEIVPLSSFFNSKKPVILSPVYFDCSSLCNFHLNGLTDALKNLDWSPGKQFDVIAFSFDPKETPAVASAKKANYIKSYGRPETEMGWHFITADADTVKKLTESVGFKYKWNENVKEWAHASAAIIISPEGKISRYLHGIQFETRDIKLALNEAANGKVGNIVDSAMLFCFKYDAHQSKYGLQVFNLMKLAGAITVLALALWLTLAMARAKREST